LEPHGMQLNTTEVHDVNILQDKAPLLVETLLEARTASRGLSFNDIITMVSVLEQMMFDESVTLLQAAYRLNGLSVEEQVDGEMLHKVMQSYLLLFGQGSKANLGDASRHKALLASPSTEGMKEFEQDTVLNFEYARQHRVNPFKPRAYSFQGAAEIMEELAQQYGKWQNSECHDMKAHLVELDPEGIGSVPLGLFYAQPEGASYHFSESADYLRQIGALDETTVDRPKVLIANYVGGPSNCIASSSYYSVCCISECAEILSDLERHVSAPTVAPATLLPLVSKLSETALPRGLPEKLETIAAHHGGKVPLHGRLFAQWLHFAFPHECPFPSLLASASALSASQWLDGGSVASEQERKQHLDSTSSAAAPTAADFDIDGRWSDHEVLPLLGKPQQSLFQMAAGALRAAAQLVALVVVVQSAVTAWRRGAASIGGSAKKKDDDFMHSLYV